MIIYSEGWECHILGTKSYIIGLQYYSNVLPIPGHVQPCWVPLNPAHTGFTATHRTHSRQKETEDIFIFLFISELWELWILMVVDEKGVRVIQCDCLRERQGFWQNCGGCYLLVLLRLVCG